jgi:DUF3072 family protein
LVARSRDAVEGTTVPLEHFQNKPEATTAQVHNPKTDPFPDDHTEKGPDDWTTGDDPMTGAQASYLKTVAERAHDPDAFAERLTKAAASKRIDALRERLKL